MSRNMRRYRVHGRHEDVHHGRVVEDTSFEAAAISYVEHMAAQAGVAPEIRVIVHSLETGHEHSFLVHLDSGEIAPET